MMKSRIGEAQIIKADNSLGEFTHIICERTEAGIKTRRPEMGTIEKSCEYRKNCYRAEMALHP